MRIALHIDGASTEEVRHLAVLLHQVGLTGQLEVGCDGPEKWNARTPKLNAHDYEYVLRNI